MPRTLRLLAAVATAAALLAGCGEEPEVVDVGARIPPAADTVECAEGSEVESRSVSDGSRPGHEDASTALRAWAKRMAREAGMPSDGYQVALEEVGTVLFTREREDRVEVAVIAERTEDKDGDLGWMVQSWARCRG